MAHVLGACSPKTTCRNVTTLTATVDPTPPRARKLRDRGSVANQSWNRCVTVSWATYPSKIDATVMPSCAAES